MTIYYAIMFFLFGTILGSFFNVVGTRLPQGKSIVKPPSHCDSCGHKLKPGELIPVLSYLFQKGKCKKCKKKISIINPLFEILTGVLFALSYLVYGMNLELIIVLTFVSILMIIIVSDIQFLVIPDEIVIIGAIVLTIEIFFIKGLRPMLESLISGSIAFAVMYIIKKGGDYLFKKESMGGGDVKLMFLFGLVLGWPMAIMSIFIGSLVGLPISFIVMLNHSNNIIPFGPFLSIGAIIITLLKLNLDKIINLLK